MQASMTRNASAAASPGVLSTSSSFTRAVTTGAAHVSPHTQLTPKQSVGITDSDSGSDYMSVMSHTTRPGWTPPNVLQRSGPSGSSTNRASGTMTSVHTASFGMSLTTMDVEAMLMASTNTRLSGSQTQLGAAGNTGSSLLYTRWMSWSRGRTESCLNPGATYYRLSLAMGRCMCPLNAAAHVQLMDWVLLCPSASILVSNMF